MNFRYTLNFILIAIVAGSILISCVEKKTDTSLSVEAYKNFGMPDPDKQWTIEDYKRAHHVLSKLKWESQPQLPFKGSKKSGLVFNRLVSLDYLSFLNDSIPLSEKAQRITEFGRVYDYWIDVYTVPTVKGKYNTELAEIRIFNLKIAEAAFQLANQINESEAPEDKALRFGYPSIKRAYLDCINNYLQPRILDLEFSEADMKMMIDSIHQSLTRNKKWFDNTEIIKIKAVLHSVKDSTSSHQLRDEYSRLANSLSS